MIKQKLAVVLVLLACCLGLGALAEEARDLTADCDFKTSSTEYVIRALYNRDFTNKPWKAAKTRHPYVAATAPSGEKIYGLYVCFATMPESYEVQVGKGSEGWETLAAGQEGIYHAYFDIPQGASRVRIWCAGEAKTEFSIHELYLFGAGDTPDWVQRWQPSLTQADILFVAAHPDDDLIFFGGGIPTYAGELGRRVAVAYLSYSNIARRSELLNALWALGVRSYPYIGSFRDNYTTGKLSNWYKAVGGEDKVLSWLTTVLRQSRPQVVVSQDVNGEYGHPQHKMLADAIQKAYDLAADPGYTGAEGLEPWQVKKLYLHLWSENQITLDWSQPLSAFGGKTGLELADWAYTTFHQTQRSSGMSVLDEGLKYDNRVFGLVRTEVGPDEARSDFLEHIPLTAPAGMAADAAAEPDASAEAADVPAEDPAEPDASAEAADIPAEDPAEPDTSTDAADAAAEADASAEAADIPAEDPAEPDASADAADMPAEDAAEPDPSTDAADAAVEEPADADASAGGLDLDALMAEMGEETPEAEPAADEALFAPWPLPEEVARRLPALNARGFVDGEDFVLADDEAGLWVYISRTLKIIIQRSYEVPDKKHPFYCFTADIWCDTEAGELPHVVFADPEKPRSTHRYISTIAQDNQVVFATSTDYYTYRIKQPYATGIEVREGEIFFDEPRKNPPTMPNYETLAFYPDGSLGSWPSTEKSAQEYLDEGAYNVFCFGPCLVRDGKLTDYVATANASYNPRYAFGMVEKGHYVGILCEGRLKRSKGVQMACLAQMLLDHGCEIAVNLDGGQTAVFCFMGQQLNQIDTNVPKGRAQAECLAFGRQ